jgi:hypothetical protein
MDHRRMGSFPPRTRTSLLSAHAAWSRRVARATPTLEEFCQSCGSRSGARMIPDAPPCPASRDPLVTPGQRSPCFTAVAMTPRDSGRHCGSRARLGWARIADIDVGRWRWRWRPRRRWGGPRLSDRHARALRGDRVTAMPAAADVLELTHKVWLNSGLEPGRLKAALALFSLGHGVTDLRDQ